MFQVGQHVWRFSSSGGVIGAARLQVGVGVGGGAADGVGGVELVVFSGCAAGGAPDGVGRVELVVVRSGAVGGSADCVGRVELADLGSDVAGCAGRAVAKLLGPRGTVGARGRVWVEAESIPLAMYRERSACAI